MKALMIALLSLAPALSFASDASEINQGPYAPVAGHATCREGQTQIFLEYNAENDSVAPVARTCHNGAFATTPKVTYKSCREGAVEMVIVYNASNDSQERVTKVCHNGVWQ